MAPEEHITQALDAIAAEDAEGARRAIAAARRAHGLWTTPLMRASSSMGRRPDPPTESTPREQAAEWLDLAADAMDGDTWPGHEPYYVREFMTRPHMPEEPPSAEVTVWLREHWTISVPRARLYLQSALAILRENV